MQGEGSAIEHRAESVRSELERERLATQTLQVQRETVQNQLAEEQREPEEVLQTLPEGANEPEWQRALEKIANRIARLALRYILCNPAITAPIPGLITPEQVDNVALSVVERRELDVEERAELDARRLYEPEGRG